MMLSEVLPALFDNYFIKIIFLAHATLVALVSIWNYSSSAVIVYSSYNLLFLFPLLLTIVVDRNADIILTTTAFNVISILIDILFVIFESPYMGVFATLLVVVNLILRPMSTILLLRNYSARAGVEDPTSGLLEVNVQSAVPQARSAYHNIDEPSQTLP